MIREIFKMLNQYAVDNQSHVTSQPVSFPPHPVPGGMLSRCLGMPSRKDKTPDTGIRMVFRETFLQIQWRLLHHLIRKSQTHGSLMYQNTHHRI